MKFQTCWVEGQSNIVEQLAHFGFWIVDQPFVDHMVDLSHEDAIEMVHEPEIVSVETTNGFEAV